MGSEAMEECSECHSKFEEVLTIGDADLCYGCSELRFLAAILRETETMDDRPNYTGGQGIVIARQQGEIQLLIEERNDALLGQGIAVRALEEQARKVRVPLEALHELCADLGALHLIETALRALEARG